MNACPFAEGKLVPPPSEALGALSAEYQPGSYGQDFRAQLRQDFGEIDEPTLNAIELQRYLMPVVAEVYGRAAALEPQTVASEIHGRADLHDVRIETQATIFQIAQAAYRTYAEADPARRRYHDAIAEQHLAGKERSGHSAADRLGDAVGTSVNIPFKLFSAIDTQAREAAWGQADIPASARASWRFVHQVAQLDLRSYGFLTGKLFVPYDYGRGAINAYRFTDSKWAQLITFDPEQKAFGLDISPLAIGRCALQMNQADIDSWEQVLGTGADRLRCPITRLPKSLTQQYVGTLVSIIQAAGVWPK